MVSRLKSITKSSNQYPIYNENITVDAKHSDMVRHFKQLQESLPELNKDLKRKVSEYNNKDPTRKNDLEYIIYRDQLKENIRDIKERIKSIQSNEEMNRYYLEVGTLLHSYYENIENTKNDDKEDIEEELEENLFKTSFEDEEEGQEGQEEDDESKTQYKSVLEFFNTRTNVAPAVPMKQQLKQQALSSKTDLGYASMKMSDFVKQEAVFKKKDILDEYLSRIDPTRVTKIKIEQNIFQCPHCKIEMTMLPSDGIQICENCGLQENILIESDKPSFKDPKMEQSYFSYKRINHYNEFAYRRQKFYSMNPIFSEFIKRFIKNEIYFLSDLFRKLYYQILY